MKSGMHFAISVTSREAWRVLRCFQRHRPNYNNILGPTILTRGVCLAHNIGQKVPMKLLSRKNYLRRDIFQSVWSLHCFPNDRTKFLISSGGLEAKTKSFNLRSVHNDAKQGTEDEKLTSDNTKIVDNKKHGTMVKLKNMINSFWLGCKQLMWIDARKAWATKKKLKHHDYDLTILTREELRHMRQTKKDIFKSLPVALLFFVPFIGYLAPVIGFLFPKKLLSHQFWNAEQMKKFAFEDHVKRSQYYLPLIQELGWSSRELKNQPLFKLCIKAIDKGIIENDELLKVKDVFHQELTTVDGMPRFHLVKLCKTWLLPVKWYIPGKILREYLTYRIKQIIEDDQAIRREGIAALTDHCVRQACHARGLDKYSFNIQVMREWLTDWLDLTTSLTDKDLSFIAHCAAFKTINFDQGVEDSSRFNAEDEEMIDEDEI